MKRILENGTVVYIPNETPFIRAVRGTFGMVLYRRDERTYLIKILTPNDEYPKNDNDTYTLTDEKLIPLLDSKLIKLIL